MRVWLLLRRLHLRLHLRLRERMQMRLRHRVHKRGICGGDRCRRHGGGSRSGRGRSRTSSRGGCCCCAVAEPRLVASQRRPPARGSPWQAPAGAWQRRARCRRGPVRTCLGLASIFRVCRGPSSRQRTPGGRIFSFGIRAPRIRLDLDGLHARLVFLLLAFLSMMRPLRAGGRVLCRRRRRCRRRRGCHGGRRRRGRSRGIAGPQDDFPYRLSACCCRLPPLLQC